MQTQNRIFDDLARLFSNAAGAAQGLREEVEVLVRSQAERLIGELNLVSREEFDAARTMAVTARDEASRLAERVAALEATIAGLQSGQGQNAAPADGAPDDDVPLEPSL